MPLKLLLIEEELLARTALGDERAFAVIYDTYYGRIYTRAMRLLHSESLAEELVQEVFLKLWRLGPALVDIRNLDAFLNVTTRNLAISGLRRIALEHQVSKSLSYGLDDCHNETEEAIILKDTRKLIDAAVNKLPKQQRQVYQLCHIEGLKYEQAAEKLNLSPLTVQTHMKRALRSLRTYLQDHTDIAVLLIIMKII